MSTVVVFGVTGYSGRAIAAELARRGHEVTGVSRTVEPGTVDGVRLVRGSVTEPAGLVRDADTVIVAVSTRPEGAPEPREYLRELLAATAGKRIGIIGGAGSVKVAEDGPLLLDTPDFPAAFRAEALGQKEVLDELRATGADVDWFFVSPAAGYGAYAPGPTTGKYRVSEDVLLTDADGQSRLSAGDLAIAVADEVDRPAHRRARLHVAY